MISYGDSVVIKAPVSEVFAYVDDLSRTSDWLVGLVEVRNVKGTGEGQQCEWTYKMVGILLHGEAVVVESVANERSRRQTIGMLDANWTMTFEPHDDGTKLSVEIEYSIPGSVLGKLAEHLTLRRMERDLASSLLNLKEIFEG